MYNHPKIFDMLVAHFRFSSHRQKVIDSLDPEAETGKATTFLEREAVAVLHKAIFCREDRGEQVAANLINLSAMQPQTLLTLNLNSPNHESRKHLTPKCKSFWG